MRRHFVQRCRYATSRGCVGVHGRAVGAGRAAGRLGQTETVRTEPGKRHETARGGFVADSAACPGGVSGVRDSVAHCAAGCIIRFEYAGDRAGLQSWIRRSCGGSAVARVCGAGMEMTKRILACLVLWLLMLAGCAQKAAEKRYPMQGQVDRKSTRLNSSHLGISYA